MIRRTERGWAGHFICGDRCTFRRNTLLRSPASKRIVVSTVGCMRMPNGKFEELGAGRHYETMAFEASKQGTYWDADVSKQVSFDSPWMIPEITNNSDNEANEMHERVVTEIAERMMRDEGLQGSDATLR